MSDSCLSGLSPNGAPVEVSIEAATGIAAPLFCRFVVQPHVGNRAPSERYALSSVILGTESDPSGPVYDAVTLWLPAEMTDPPGHRFFDALSSYEERTDARTGEVYHVGKLDNLRVRSRPEGVSITGSLARFHFGDNLETLTCPQTGEVLERLSDTLGLSIASAKVTSLEFGANLVVVRRPVEYFAHLGHASFYRRSEINMSNGFGLYYANGRRELAFYDKRQEMKNRKGRKLRLPESLIGRNLLRYELRLRRNVGDQLATIAPSPADDSSADAIGGASLGSGESGLMGRPTIKAGRLHNPRFYRGLVSRWEREYRAIHRRAILRPLSASIGGPRMFKEQLAAFGLERLGGADAVLALLESSHRRGEIEPNHYKRNKRLVEELAASPAVTIESELIAELDRVVCDTAARFR